MGQDEKVDRCHSRNTFAFDIYSSPSQFPPRIAFSFLSYILNGSLSKKTMKLRKKGEFEIRRKKRTKEKI